MFSERLKYLRVSKGKSQEELSRLLDITRGNLSHLETGRNEPDNELLLRIATYFDVSVDYLLGNDIPDWATKEDMIELDEMLESNVTMAYGGERLTEEEKQRVKDVLTTIFWDKVQKRKKHEEK